MAAHIDDLYHKIIASTAQAILKLDPISEIRDMIVDTTAYRSVLRAWTDPDTGLNLLQVAIVVAHTEAVKCFSEYKFSSVFGRTIWDDRGDVPNPALHLACKVGVLELVQYFVEEKRCDLTAKAVVTYGCMRGSDDSQECVARGQQVVDAEEEIDAPVARKLCSCHEDINLATHRAVNENHLAFPLQTAYEVAILGRHVDCANYLCEYIVKNMEKPLHPLTNSSLLHHSAYLGSANHIRLLLDTGHRPHLNERDSTGHMPVHVAALTAEAECLRVLLESGARLNAQADHRSCLHIMYWSKFRPEKFLACTRVLVEHGADVNAMDHNNNTALDYLAWELGQKWYQVSKAWITMHSVSEAHRYCYTNACTPQPTMDDGQFRAEILKCMRLLLDTGASTLVHSCDGRVDHTIMHTLLQNTGWPPNCSLRQRPMEVYRALQLLFDFGADPNVIARNNNESALTMLLMHSLHEVPPELKLQFVAMFVMNSADLECLIPEPKQYRENYLDRRWNVYPVMVALQERHPISIVQMLYNFMSLSHVYRSLRMTADKFLWHRMTWTLGSSSAKEDKYRQEWLSMRRPRMRALKHSAKLQILNHIRRKGRLAERLPLPRALVEYLQSAHY